MSLLTQKRAMMTLFSGTDDFSSHQVRLVLEEKGIVYSLESVDPNALPEELVELNPYRTLPTLLDRDLVLYNPHIIMEYLDERFPHPPLIPVYPVARAHSRLIMYRMKLDWFEPLNQALHSKTSKDLREKIISQIQEGLHSITQVFDSFDFFMSEEFGLIDAYLAPMLWQLSKLDKLPEKGLYPKFDDYLLRIFERPSFLKSLNPFVEKAK